MSIVNMRVGGKVKKLQLTESFPLNLQEKTATANGEVVADEGYAGLSKVAVNVPIPEGYIKPTGTKTITANGTHDVSGYANAEVNVPTSGGGGSGECSGTHIIEVTELPTDNIDETAMYLCDGEYYKRGYVEKFNDVLVVMGTTSMLFSTMISKEGIPCAYHIIPTRTTTGIIVTDESNGYHLYYVKDEDNVFAYGGDEYGWMPIPAMFEMEYGGIISNASEATADGVYALMESGSIWNKYSPGIQVIEVGGLPDENIDETALYACNGAYYKYVTEFAVWLLISGNLVEVKDFREANGLSCSYNVIPTKTTDNILPTGNGAVHFYYIEDEGGVFTYREGEWTEDVDIVSNLSEVTDANYYAIVTIGFKKYFAPRGMTTITENGGHDVSEYVTAKVAVPNVHMVQISSELPEDAPAGSMAIVLGGA